MVPIKLDENLPEELAASLRALGADVDTVLQESLAGHRDERIFAAAVQEGRLLITQDLDFSDLRKYRPGSHPGIILVRLHNPSRRQLLARLETVLSEPLLEQCRRCFVVITDRKIRIRQPDATAD
jgi:predicted nuclease of predicted toxin-antitoxin system